MTRHMRNIAKSRTTSRRYAPGAHAQVIEANNTIVSAELATAWLKTTRDIDTAHAVALERERIAAWLDSFSDGTAQDEYHDLAEYVRSGEHNTPDDRKAGK